MAEPLPSVSLDDVLAIDKLTGRPPRTPNLQAETQALHTLARQLAEHPQTMLNTLVTMAKDLCQAGTAGVSLLETTPEGDDVFRWSAISGALQAHEQETTPRHFSPCGVCLDHQTPQLYDYPERYFTGLKKAKPTIVEGLVIPLIAAHQPLGTIWVASHDETRQFDAEDMRIMISLANFTAAALQSIHLRQTTEVALQREQAARQEAEAARQALNESAQRAVDILESITDAFVCVDHDWRITYANQEAARLADVHLDQLIGKIDQEIQPCVVARVIEQTRRRIAVEQRVSHFETVCDATYRWLEIHAYPCRVGFSIYFRDITPRKQQEVERRQAEMALHQSESRFRLIVESAKDYAIFTLDSMGLITSWNSGAERLLGYKEAEIIGHHSRIIFTPDDNHQGRAEQEIQTALAQGRAEDERWHVRKDGRRFFASGLMTPLRDEAGQLQGLMKILRDVTAARQTAEREQFLSAASAVLTESIDATTILFSIARLAVPFLADLCFFDIVNVNHQLERRAWHSSDPVRRQGVEPLQRYVPSPTSEGHPIAHVLSSGNTNFVPQVCETWMPTTAISADYLQFIRDYQVRSLITVPLIAHGRKLGALTVGLTAIAHRHYTQADLRVVEELGRRTALALDNARLYQQAQDANQMKDEFLAVLSHELRSPLNPILGWVQMIRKGHLDAAKTEKAWMIIERNAKLQAQLVEDLLDISQILRGKLRLTVGRVELGETIRAAIETVQLAAQAKSIQIEVRLDASSAPVTGDATRLQQVVWNLLSNAVKFTPEGGRVEVCLERVDSDRPPQWQRHPVEDERSPVPPVPHCPTPYAQVTVSDTGVGIHATFLPRVFDYFRQADSATTRRFGGLGLGLAIVRQLVEAHGGTVWAESTGEGEGATFTVRLPLVSSHP